VLWLPQESEDGATFTVIQKFENKHYNVKLNCINPRNPQFQVDNINVIIQTHKNQRSISKFHQEQIAFVPEDDRLTPIEMLNRNKYVKQNTSHHSFPTIHLRPQEYIINFIYVSVEKCRINDNRILYTLFLENFQTSPEMKTDDDKILEDYLHKQ